MAHHLACTLQNVDCEFEARSDDPEELVDVMLQHADQRHGRKLSRTEAQRLVGRPAGF
jgi:predicted small metal-binding protein